MALTKSPVQEVGFSVQFAPLSPNLMDIAALGGRFERNFPICQQVAPLPPLEFFPTPMMEIVQLPAESLPRVWFISEDSHGLIQIQRDRFGFNWRRLAPPEIPAEYPGYVDLRAKYAENLDALAEWSRARSLDAPEFQIAELLYVNLVPVEIQGQKRRISDILAFYEPKRRRPVNLFQAHWIESLSDDFPSSLSIQAALARTVDGASAVLVNFIARFDIQTLDANSVLARFDVAHGSVHEALPYVFTDAVMETLR